MHASDFRDIEKDNILSVAKEMKEKGCPLVVIIGYIDKEGKPVIEYSFDDSGNIITYRCFNEYKLPSITSIYKTAAEWFEEEISEFMGVEFEGLEKKGRLFLPEEFDGSGRILVSSLSELRKR